MHFWTAFIYLFRLLSGLQVQVNGEGVSSFISWFIFPPPTQSCDCVSKISIKCKFPVYKINSARVESGHLFWIQRLCLETWKMMIMSKSAFKHEQNAFNSPYRNHDQPPHAWESGADHTYLRLGAEKCLCPYQKCALLFGKQPRVFYVPTTAVRASQAFKQPVAHSAAETFPQLPSLYSEKLDLSDWCLSGSCVGHRRILEVSSGSNHRQPPDNWNKGSELATQKVAQFQGNTNPKIFPWPIEGFTSVV